MRVYAAFGMHDARFARGADEGVRPYTGLFSGEIFFFENAAVVEFVPGGDVSQGADADFVVVGDAAAHPGLLVEIAKERQRSAADGDIVFDDFGQRTRGEGAVADVVVLLETGQRSAVSARDAQSSDGNRLKGSLLRPLRKN